MALRAVPDHPKFFHLKGIIKRNKAATLGYLECIWHFTGRFTPAGNIGKYHDESIEAWCEWDGAPGELISALVKSGWLDPNERYRLVVHDWREHADRATRMSVKRSGSDLLSSEIHSEQRAHIEEHRAHIEEHRAQDGTQYAHNEEQCAQIGEQRAQDGAQCSHKSAQCAHKDAQCAHTVTEFDEKVPKTCTPSSLPEPVPVPVPVNTPPLTPYGKRYAVVAANGGGDDGLILIEKFLRQKLPGLTQNQIAEVLLMVDQGRCSRVGLDNLLSEVDRNNPRSREALFMTLLRKPGIERANQAGPPPREPPPEPDVPEHLDEVTNWEDLTWDLMSAAEAKLPSLATARTEMAQVCGQMELLGRSNGTIYAHAPPMIAAFRRLMEERGVVFVRHGSVAAATSTGG